MAIILDGKDVSSFLRADLRDSIATFTKGYGYPPRLAVIQVGDDPASSVYIRQKEKACADVGIMSTTIKLDANDSFVDSNAYDTIRKLNEDPQVHGILLQLPLPEKIDYATRKLINAIAPNKDADCLTDVNLGKLYASKSVENIRIAPCTPAGIMALARAYGIRFKGMNCVIVGRSSIVSKPLASMLLCEDATVSICHSRTQNLCDYTKNADALFVAAGYRDLITPDMVKPGVIVFDIGITRDENNKLHGDVHPDVKEVAGYMTPVPGGVGPMTVYALLKNTLNLARLR